MGALCCTLIESESELGEFNCGNPSINTLVAESFYPHILKQIRVYKLSIQGMRVGFCSVSILAIALDNSDAPVAEFFDKTPTFAALKLDYLAVDEKVQNMGIGSTALQYIITEAQALHNMWPIRLLVLDALRDKIDWYTRKGFQALNKSELSGSSPTVQMYIDLMTDAEKQRVDEYSFYDY